MRSSHGEDNFGLVVSLGEQWLQKQLVGCRISLFSSEDIKLSGIPDGIAKTLHNIKSLYKVHTLLHTAMIYLNLCLVLVPALTVFDL